MVKRRSCTVVRLSQLFDVHDEALNSCYVEPLNQVNAWISEWLDSGDTPALAVGGDSFYCLVPLPGSLGVGWAWAEGCKPWFVVVDGVLGEFAGALSHGGLNLGEAGFHVSPDGAGCLGDEAEHVGLP